MENENTLYAPTPEQLRIFERDMLPHLAALYNFAYSLVNNETDAQDLVQVAYMKAYTNIEKFTPGTSPKAWLFTILKNSMINEYRRKSRAGARVDYDEIAAYQDNEDASYTKYVDLREEIFEGLIGDEVTQALDLLPEAYRTIILLCDVEEFKYEEIAQIIDIPVGTVRSRLFRARNMLKERLTEYAKQQGYRDHRSKS